MPCRQKGILLAVSLVIARPALAQEVFTAVDSAACDDYSVSLETRGNWVGTDRESPSCEMGPGLLTSQAVHPTGA